MANKEARRRYFKIFFPAMAGYIISIFSVSAVIDKSADVTWVNYALTAIPTVFVFIWFWSHARYILEVDEFIRSIQIKCVLWGLIGLMCLTTAWGFLEMFAQVPAVPIFYVLPGFYLCYGLAAAIISKRENAGCEIL